ncbi:MAG: hypothetical protein WCD66_05105, partial [Rhodanobacteraceae bacterium]
MSWRHLAGSLALLVLGTMATAARADVDPRMQALAQYKHDLISVLVLRADAPHLLGAALLSRTFSDSSPGQDYASLLKRAAAADPDNAAVIWARLGDCDRKAQDCPNADALSRLEDLAADNAAVWLLVLDQAARDGDRDAQLAALEKAADARGYNDYGGAVLQALTLAATALPVPDAAVRAYAGNASGNAGPASAQAFLAYGQATAQPEPGFLPVMGLCDPKANDEADKLLASCRKLGHVLAWGSSPRARAAGLHLQDILAATPEARAEARSDMRDLVWQLRNYSRLTLKALSDQSLAVELLRLGQSGGSELTRMSALLQQQGIPLRTPRAASPAAASSSDDTGPKAPISARTTNLFVSPAPTTSTAQPAEAASAPASSAST